MNNKGNLPDEKAEVKFRTMVLHFLRENVTFVEGNTEEVKTKLVDLTEGIYKIWLQNR